MVDELFASLRDCFTLEVAQSLVRLRAMPMVQEKLDEFAEKSSEGTLTAEERVHYVASLRAINFISILQMKARALIPQTAE